MHTMVTLIEESRRKSCDRPALLQKHGGGWREPPIGLSGQHPTMSPPVSRETGFLPGERVPYSPLHRPSG